MPLIGDDPILVIALMLIIGAEWAGETETTAKVAAAATARLIV
jgi:hypothetical protein